MKPLSLILPLLLSGFSVAGADDLTVNVDLSGNTQREAGLHVMLGIGERDWELASGVTSTIARLKDGRTYGSVQPVFPIGGGLTGLILGAGAGSSGSLIGGGIGWLAGQILTNSEARVGSEHFSVFGAHQLDLFVPGWHPREKITLGVDGGYGVRLRAGAFRSFSSIGDLDGFGFEGRILVPLR
ncbi:MAG: hypothetical protein RL318_2949 [Fibrobacterota bacterium]|jgi:hypothetical protein